MKAAGRHRDDAAAAAAEEEEEEEEGEEEKGRGAQGEGGVQTASGNQLLPDERQRRCLSFPARPQESCPGDLNHVNTASVRQEKQETTIYHRVVTL